MTPISRPSRAVAAALTVLLATLAPASRAADAQERDGLLAGHGLGMARAAELNGYPGPRHVLELADALELSADQRARSEALFKRMQADAQALGAELVAEEARLERLFAQGLARSETLRPLLERINSLRGELRLLHLEAHLAQAQALDPEQIERYYQLRHSPESAPGRAPHHAH